MWEKLTLDDGSFIFANGEKFKYYCVPNINRINKEFKGKKIYQVKNGITSIVAVILDVKADDIFFLAEEYDLMGYTLEAIANFIQNLGVDNNDYESKLGAK